MASNSSSKSRICSWFCLAIAFAFAIPATVSLAVLQMIAVVVSSEEIMNIHCDWHCVAVDDGLTRMTLPHKIA